MIRPMISTEDSIEHCYQQFISVDWLLLYKKVDNNELKKMVDRCTLPLVQRLEQYYVALIKNTNQKTKKSEVLKRARNVKANISAADKIAIGQTNGNDEVFRQQKNGIFTMDTEMVREYMRRRIDPLFAILQRELKHKQ